MHATTKLEDRHTTASRDVEEFDVVVVGAGWAGMYALFALRNLGLRVVVCEAGSGVGGTWYWNRYPGARCDGRSVNYSFSFSPELEQEWTWTERYAAQPEIEAYANQVADRFDLRRDIRFNTKVVSATHSEPRNRWDIVTANGDHLIAMYFVLATGGYSKPVEPDLPGVGSFAGESYLTARWPQQPVDFTGKRVGVVGTGASGMQTITVVAQEPIQHLYVFQRTANFAVPAQNKPVDPGAMAAFKANYRAFRERARWSGSGTVYQGPVGSIADLPDEEFEQRMDQAWIAGGLSVCGGISDLMSSRRANERVSNYLRRQIKKRVKDPATAELLSARGFTLGARRMLVETEYFEAFNRSNVTLVDVRADPLQRVVPDGLETATRLYELDTIIWAIGFDSGTGAILEIDVRGRGGESLAEHWADGPSTFLGLGVHGFPNAFFIAGPGSPSIRSNVIVSIEQHVEWIAEFITYLRKHRIDTAEPTAEAERKWTDYLNALVEKSLLAADDTQYFGSNIPGKPRSYLAYIGGVGNYRKICDDVRDAGYEGYALTAAGEDRTRSADWSGPHLDGTMPARFGSTVI